jgi:glycosyltransferase involved in cell wall biosynthesis
MRMLLISYHWGPACSTGGFRWNAMVKDLVALGWSVDVITSDRPAETFEQWLREAGLPEAVRAYPLADVRWPERVLNGLMKMAGPLRRRNPKPVAVAAAGPLIDAAAADALPIWKPGKSTTRRSRIIRSIVALRDLAEMRVWNRRAVRLGVRLGREREYDVVVVSSPPHYTQQAGAAIGRRLGIPYVADLRDPWVLGTGELRSYMNPVMVALAQRAEPLVARAAAIVHNTDAARRALASDYGRSGAVRVAIPNAYDSVADCIWPDSDVFRIAYTGWVHPYMDFRVLLRACSRFRDRHGLDPDRLRLDLMGTPTEILGVPLKALLEAYGLAQFTQLHRHGSRSEATALQQRAALLPAFDYPHGLAVVMKFYDYLNARGALLLLSRPGSALDEAARRIGFSVVAPEDDVGIDAAVDAAWTRWLRRDYSTVNDSTGLFHRRHRSLEMHGLLLQVLARGSARGSVKDASLAEVN